MVVIRGVVAIIIFCLGLVFAADLFNNGVDNKAIVFMILSFVAAYIAWPSRKKGQRENNNIFLDTLEFLIEAPVDIVISTLKMIGRFFGRVSDGVDLDV